MTRSRVSAMRAGFLAVAFRLAIALVPGRARAGRVVSDPNADTPDLVGLASRNPTLVVPRIFLPDGSPPDAISEPGTADDEQDLNSDSDGPDADAPDAADVPDLPDSGAVAVNPESGTDNAANDPAEPLDNSDATATGDDPNNQQADQQDDQDDQDNASAQADDASAQASNDDSDPDVG